MEDGSTLVTTSCEGDGADSSTLGPGLSGRRGIVEAGKTEFRVVMASSSRHPSLTIPMRVSRRTKSSLTSHCWTRELLGFLLKKSRMTSSSLLRSLSHLGSRCHQPPAMSLDEEKLSSYLLAPSPRLKSAPLPKNPAICVYLAARRSWSVTSLLHPDFSASRLAEPACGEFEFSHTISHLSNTRYNLSTASSYWVRRLILSNNRASFSIELDGVGVAYPLEAPVGVVTVDLSCSQIDLQCSSLHVVARASDTTSPFKLDLVLGVRYALIVKKSRTIS